MSMLTETPGIVMKALVAEITDEFNRVRGWLGKTPVTYEQVKANVDARITVIKQNIKARTDGDFDWMEDVK